MNQLKTTLNFFNKDNKDNKVKKAKRMFQQITLPSVTKMIAALAKEKGKTKLDVTLELLKETEEQLSESTDAKIIAELIIQRLKLIQEKHRLIKLFENSAKHYVKNKKQYKINKEKYYQENKDKFKTRKEKIAEYKKEYRLRNKDKIAKYHKEYRLRNKDKFQKYNKKYRLKNKEKIAKQNSKYYFDKTKKKRAEAKALNTTNQEMI